MTPAVRVLAIVAVNLALVVATQAAFRVWAVNSWGQIDYDMIGLSWRPWLPLVVVGTVLAAAGVRYRWASLGVAVVVVVLLVILLDHALGALEDGTVEPPGALVASLLAANVGTLVASAWLARASASSPTRLLTATLLAIAGVLVLGQVVVVTRGPGPSSTAAIVETWLGAMAGEAQDRGWSYLHDATKAEMSRDAYVAGAQSVDWSEVEWEVEEASEMDGATWLVSVVVDGGLRAVPDFLLDEQLVTPDCMYNSGRGFMVYVVAQLLDEPRIVAPSMTGTMERAAASRECPTPGPMPTPAVRWTEDLTGTGFKLEAYNRTTLDLFLQDRNGTRVDLPACGRASANDIDLNGVEVRAADGYVGTFFTGSLPEGQTWFVVVLADFVETNGAPPAAPLPPCEGEPQVQQGF